MEDQKGGDGELEALLFKFRGERTFQAWADEVLDEHQLSAEAGTTWSQGSLPVQGLWKRFFECLAEGRCSRKPERKENFAVVVGLTEAGAMAAGWRWEVICKFIRRQALLALKAEQLKRRK